MSWGIFNRVNSTHQEPYQKCGVTGVKMMYNEWTSLTLHLQNGELGLGGNSVLSKFSPEAGREIVSRVVQPIASNLGLGQYSEPSKLATQQEVEWCMEVLCYGLSLPLTEQDTIRDCVHVYCEWLTAMLPSAKATIPPPILDSPNVYSRKIIQHLYNLFVPRKGDAFVFLDAALDVINRQAMLCHRVLRVLQTVAQTSTIIERDTWETLLLFLLAINDALLSPPTIKDDIGDQLCDRVLSVLFEVWLLSCARSFPSPSLWKTFSEISQSWRHRPGLVEQWTRVNAVMTSKLLKITHGPDFPELKILDEDANLLPSDLSNEAVAQSWYRFLHLLGNPNHLCRAELVSQTPKFLQYAIMSSQVVDPSQHPCLVALPNIFLRAMKGLALLVDAFLGLPCAQYDTKRETGNSPAAGPATPPLRRPAKSFSGATANLSSAASAAFGLAKTSVSGNRVTSATASGPVSSSSSISSNSSLSSLPYEQSKATPTPLRPRCNSILHLFGDWLFEAALLGCTLGSRPTSAQLRKPSPLLTERRAFGEKPTVGPQISFALGNSSIDENWSRYDSGRAEAMGTLCRIFCAKKTDEEILPVYLARFYIALQQALKIPEDRTCNEVMASVLLHSSNLLRLDLNGVLTVLPAILDALDLVLANQDVKIKSNVAKTELRRASIHILLSALALPLHFQNLQIKELAHGERGPVTFDQCRPRLVHLLLQAVRCETDPVNTQMLLGGLMLCIQDAATYEQAEPGFPNDATSATDMANFLSSASDTYSSHSLHSFSSVSEETLDSHEGEYSLSNTSLGGISIGPSLNTAHGLFVHTTYLVCHRLITSWKSDLNVSLAALELLAGLARAPLSEHDGLECKRTVRWLCDYIVSQCSRPPPAHSRDLHSSIVAALHCCSVWVLQHPDLLKDKEVLDTLLQVLELGISGTKSQGRPGETPRLKHEKELKPVSLRVRDAAEALLTFVIEQAGYFPSPCGAESLSSQLEEIALLQQCNTWDGIPLTKDLAVRKFRYYVMEGTTILSILEDPLGNDQDPQPTVTVVIRGAFGRQAWTCQLRHLPRHRSRSEARGSTSNPGRPLPLFEQGPRPQVTPKLFPDGVECIRPCLADKSIPSLDAAVIANPDLSSEIEQLSRIMETQSSLETQIPESQVQEEDEDWECQPPPVCQEFQTARLFLSHFGLLSLEALHDILSSPVPPLVALDSTVPGFAADLEALDTTGCRTHDTVHLFYVRAGQKSAEEILNNVTSSSNVHPYFLEFLLSLGYPVRVRKHTGWTGHVSTSWTRLESPDVSLSEDTKDDDETYDPFSTPQHGGSLYNGETQVLYWADAVSEVAFVLPAPKAEPLAEAEGLTASFDRHAAERLSLPVHKASVPDKPRAFSLNIAPLVEPAPEGTPADATQRKKSSKGSATTVHLEVKILVLWLESLEDMPSLPIGDLLLETSTGLDTGSLVGLDKECFAIIIHPLQSGLFRIHLQGPAGKMTLATPLIDGMVVPRRALSQLVRQTALNMAKRRRLDYENYHPPHVRRKLKIQEMVHRYRSRLTEPAFYTQLFLSPSTPPPQVATLVRSSYKEGNGGEFKGISESTAQVRDRRIVYRLDRTQTKVMSSLRSNVKDMDKRTARHSVSEGMRSRGGSRDTGGYEARSQSADRNENFDTPVDQADYFLKASKEAGLDTRPP